MNNNNNPYKPSDLQIYNRGRAAFISMFILAFANVFFIMIWNFNFGISSSIATVVTFYFKARSEQVIFYISGILIGVICTLPYLAAFILSKDKKTWMNIGLYITILDSLILLADVTLILAGNDVLGASSYIADIAFHGWMIYAIFNALKAKKRLDSDILTEEE